ncbi:hypothetical protein SVIOM74S_07208 [Streptomyces violarus]
MGIVRELPGGGKYVHELVTALGEHIAHIVLDAIRHTQE